MDQIPSQTSNFQKIYGAAALIPLKDRIQKNPAVLPTLMFGISQVFSIHSKLSATHAMIFFCPNLSIFKLYRSILVKGPMIISLEAFKSMAFLPSTQRGVEEIKKENIKVGKESSVAD